MNMLPRKPASTTQRQRIGTSSTSRNTAQRSQAACGASASAAASPRALPRRAQQLPADAGATKEAELYMAKVDWVSIRKHLEAGGRAGRPAPSWLLSADTSTSVFEEWRRNKQSPAPPVESGGSRSARSDSRVYIADLRLQAPSERVAKWRSAQPTQRELRAIPLGGSAVAAAATLPPLGESTRWDLTASRGRNSWKLKSIQKAIQKEAAADGLSAPVWPPLPLDMNFVREPKAQRAHNHAAPTGEALLQHHRKLQRGDLIDVEQQLWERGIDCANKSTAKTAVLLEQHKSGLEMETFDSEMHEHRTIPEWIELAHATVQRWNAFGAEEQPATEDVRIEEASHSGAREGTRGWSFLARGNQEPVTAINNEERGTDTDGAKAAASAVVPAPEDNWLHARAMLWDATGYGQWVMVRVCAADMRANSYLVKRDRDAERLVEEERAKQQIEELDLLNFDEFGYTSIPPSPTARSASSQQQSSGDKPRLVRRLTQPNSEMLMAESDQGVWVPRLRIHFRAEPAAGFINRFSEAAERAQDVNSELLMWLAAECTPMDDPVDMSLRSAEVILALGAVRPPAHCQPNTSERQNWDARVMELQETILAEAALDYRAVMARLRIERVVEQSKMEVTDMDPLSLFTLREEQKAMSGSLRARERTSASKPGPPIALPYTTYASTRNTLRFASCIHLMRAGGLQCAREQQRWICAFAAQGGALQTLEWLHVQGYEWDEVTMAKAAALESAECLKFAHANGCPWDGRACATAAAYGRFDNLEFLRENSCPWDERTYENAVRFGHDDIAQWAIDNGCPAVVEERRGRISRINTPISARRETVSGRYTANFAVSPAARRSQSGKRNSSGAFSRPSSFAWDTIRKARAWYENHRGAHDEAGSSGTSRSGSRSRMRASFVFAGESLEVGTCRPPSIEASQLVPSGAGDSRSESPFLRHAPLLVTEAEASSEKSSFAEAKTLDNLFESESSSDEDQQLNELLKASPTGSTISGTDEDAAIPLEAMFSARDGRRAPAARRRSIDVPFPIMSHNNSFIRDDDDDDDCDVWDTDKTY